MSQQTACFCSFWELYSILLYIYVYIQYIHTTIYIVYIYTIYIHTYHNLLIHSSVVGLFPPVSWLLCKCGDKHRHAYILFFFFVFWAHPQWRSGVTPDSSEIAPGLGDDRGSNHGQSRLACARQSLHHQSSSIYSLELFSCFENRY